LFEHFREMPRVSPLFTVRDIAERVRRPNEDLTAVVDRLRNWTKEGILTHLGPKNPGRHRRYGQEGLIEAAVLSALADVGLPAVRGASFGGPARTALKLAKHAALDIDDKYRAGVTVYLIATRHSSKNPLVLLQEQREPLVVEIPDAEAAIVINLTRIFLRLFTPSEEPSDG
jgi:hypothetical protein